MTSLLSERVLKGDRIAVSKAISSVENRDEGSHKLLKDLYPHTGHAFVIGITGPPGTGKSSLVDQLAKMYRSKRSKVAILAVDPTSPVSGGAILGDRVRMLSHALDPGVYIRSMASRGDEGGLSRAARNAIRILDAAGNDIVIAETVGIGQAEVEIVSVADVVVVVLMPELGDEIQAIKAGLMEIGDIFVVNKSDLPGSDLVVHNLHSVFASRDGWKQVATKASAKTGLGLDELVSKIEEYRRFYGESQHLKERKYLNLANELKRNLSQTMSEMVEKELMGDKQFEDLIEQIADKKLDPESATAILLRRFLPSSSNSDNAKEENANPNKKTPT